MRPLVPTTLLLLALLCPASLAQASDASLWFDEGLRFDDQGDAPQAFAAFRKAAEAGLPQAEFNVAVMLDSGRGVTQDLEGAALWYAKAAARGNRRAAYNLGQLYETGQGVSQNDDLARAWYAASELGAARMHVAALRPHAASAQSPSAPVLLAPPAILRGEAAREGIELVWTAQPQPEPVQFFVEMRTLDGPAPHEVLARFVEVTSLLAPLDQPQGRYAWRVLSVARRTGHYAASGWQTFQIADDQAGADR